MREVRVLEAAAEELVEAAAHYEIERPGLGIQFQEALREAFSLLSEDILPLSTISADLTARRVRRLILRRFPFSVVVREIDQTLVEVIAVAHHSRRPRYWFDRLST